ncbi:MAG TPA: hypothetical protein VMZ71_06005 [Gemmataceae bacterium]|nr:hypothetical protein [Gemmataceae bacterium]
MWLVERDGRAVATLTDPRYEDMFWTSYRIEPLAHDPAEQATILSDEFWHVEFLARTRYRNQAGGWYGKGWWAAVGTVVLKDGRIIMRGLYRPEYGSRLLSRFLTWLMH